MVWLGWLRRGNRAPGASGVAAVKAPKVGKVPKGSFYFDDISLFVAGIMNNATLYEGLGHPQGSTTMTKFTLKFEPTAINDSQPIRPNATVVWGAKSIPVTVYVSPPRDKAMITLPS